MVWTSSKSKYTLEREQEERRKVERKKGGRSLSSSVKFTNRCCRGTMAIDVIASSLAKETRDPAVDTNRACSNKRSRENKCGCSIPVYHRQGLHLGETYMP